MNLQPASGTSIFTYLNMCKDNNIKPNFTAVGETYGCDRHTVAKYYENGGKTTKERKARASMFDPYKTDIETLINDEKYTITSIFHYLKETKPDFPGKYPAFYAYVKRLGWISRKKRTPHVRFETGPGQQLQVDWKEDVKVLLSDGSTIMIQIFSATMGYSRYHFFIPAAAKTQEEFIRCLLQCLHRLGGVPTEILTDNMSAVVTIGSDGRRKKHPAIIQFEKDCGVAIRLAKPRSPQTKGKVESSNRFIDWLRPYDGKLASLKEVEDAIAAIERTSNAENNRETGLPPMELLKREAPSLKALPSTVLIDTYIPGSSTTKVASTSLVNFRGSSYSVPIDYIGKTVVVYTTGEKVVILYAKKKIAEHAIGVGINYDKEHYKEGLRASGLDDDEIEKMASENLSRFGG